LHEYQERAEFNPDLWMRLDVQDELLKVRKLLAKLLSCSEEDLVIVMSTTSGMNAIFRSMVFNFGERILHFNTIYGSMGKLIEYIVDSSKGAVSTLIFNATYPMSNTELVTQLESFLDDHKDPDHPIKIALIDHITSVPGVILPLEQIIPLLRRHNISVLIDGAHAIGQIPVNVTALAPDYYITNCHKWLYAARGTAVMYVNKKFQSTVHPAHINSAYEKAGDNFQTEFFWTGTMDYSSYLTVPAALKFREDVGGETAIMKYTHELAVAGGNYVADRFGTRVLQHEEQIASMIDVLLPLKNHDDPTLTYEFWMTTLLRNYTAFAPPYKFYGKWWIRLSAQIYNDMDDFVKTADVFLELCDIINNKDNGLLDTFENSINDKSDNEL